MTVLEVIQRSTDFLARKGIESARLQVELLLAHTLGVPRLKLYLDFERQLTDPELDHMRQLVKRRASHEPLQHILGSVSFCGLELVVNREVLVPRPETEELAERGWQFLKSRAQPEGTPMRALDIGTGSGCLAIALAHHTPAAQVDAVDLSGAALEVARQNAARHQVADRIRFHLGNAFEPLPREARFDLIISNPPYIPTAEIEALAPEVRDFDPRLALDGGADGLEFMRRLAAEAPAFLAPEGRLMCEFGDGQGENVRRVFEDQGWRVEAIAPDLSGRARFLVAERAES